MAKSTKSAQSNEIVGEVCLYGTPSIGFGWLAAYPGDDRKTVTFGAHKPDPSTSANSAVWLATDALHEKLIARGVRHGLVRVFDAGGERCADVSLDAVPQFQNMPWKPAPVLVMSADQIAEFADATYIGGKL